MTPQDIFDIVYRHHIIERNPLGSTLTKNTPICLYSRGCAIGILPMSQDSIAVSQAADKRTIETRGDATDTHFLALWKAHACLQQDFPEPLLELLVDLQDAHDGISLDQQYTLADRQATHLPDAYELIRCKFNLNKTP